jgi:1A family penicillin-binding protein
MKSDFAFIPRKRRLRKTQSSIVRAILKKPKYFIVALVVCFIVLPFITISVIVRDLPTPDNISKNAKYSTSILDRNGEVVYQVFDDKNIIPVSLNKIPDHAWQATVAIEDKNFFKHKGYSLFGILRAFLKNVFTSSTEGGSTLTQQLVKNNLLTAEKTIIRKIKELVLAVELERRYTKKEILEMYMNMAPYGGTAYGIESASQVYFEKHAKDLTLLEGAILAGLPQRPSYYSPSIGKKDAYKVRTKEVLRRMREDKFITKEKEEELVKKLSSIKFSKRMTNIPAAHFVFYIKDLLDEMVENEALYKKGLIIKSTLDLKLQEQIEKIVKEEIKSASALNISNAAVVVIDPKSGEILAMVGSVDFNNNEFGKFNAALGLRQPGSTLKPFTYALAFENGMTPSTTIMDVQTNFKQSDSEDSYEPVNYDGKYRGPVQLRYALGSSLNVPAVKVIARIGLKPFLQLVSDAGLTTLSPSNENMERFGLSITLGGGEVRLLDLVSAYSIFANGGKSVTPNAIKEVKDYKNKTIYKQKRISDNQVISKEVSFLISHILSDNNARLLTFGNNNYLNIAGKTVAAKTGTTDDKKDNWTIGYTNDLVVGVWVGNNNNEAMNPMLSSGVSGAAPIWRRIFIQAFENGYKDGIIEKPSKIVALEVDSIFGGLPHNDYPKRSEYFILGTEPTEISPFYSKIKVLKDSNKKANPVEISRNNYDEKEYFVVYEEDPLSVDSVNRWQEAIDKWTREQPDDKWKPPTEISNNESDAISISFLEPSDGKRYDNNDIRIYIKVASFVKIKKIEVYANNELKTEASESVLDKVIHLDDGVYKLKVVALNEKDSREEKEITIGVNKDIDSITAIPTEQMENQD